MSVRVLLVHEQQLVRSGMRAILEMQPDVDVVGEASDVDDATDALGTCAPDVVLLDVTRPDGATVEAIRRLTRATSEAAAAVLVLATELGDEVPNVVRAGAGGVLLKSAKPDELRAAVQLAAAGYTLLVPYLARRLATELPVAPNMPGPHAKRLADLSAREGEVLRLLVQGKSNAEIAKVLALSPATVKSHVQRVLNKLALRDRTHAVIYAYEVGFMQPGDGGRTTVASDAGLS